MLRRELCARNASYATLEQVPYVTSYGAIATEPFHFSPLHSGSFVSLCASRMPKTKFGQ
jgi:hypothetical protein